MTTDRAMCQKPDYQQADSPADVSNFILGPRFGFLNFFSTDLPSGGDMGSKMAGAKITTLSIFLFEF